MNVIIAALIIITSLLLILIVLVQNSKGGGLTSTFASSNQILGVKKTTDYLEKATWVLAIALVVLCVFSSMTISRPENKGPQSRLTEIAPNPDASQNMPQDPSKNPATTTETTK